MDDDDDETGLWVLLVMFGGLGIILTVMVLT